MNLLNFKDIKVLEKKQLKTIFGGSSEAQTDNSEDTSSGDQPWSRYRRGGI